MVVHVLRASGTGYSGGLCGATVSPGLKIYIIMGLQGHARLFVCMFLLQVHAELQVHA